jgi:hypothetical protein
LSDRRPARDVQLKPISTRIHFIAALTHALRQQTRQLEDFRLFFLHNHSLHHDSFIRLNIPFGPGFLRRVVHDFSYVATKKLLSAKGKGDGAATIIKSVKQLFDDRLSRHPDRMPPGAGMRRVVVR